MSFTSREITQLRKLVSIAEELLSSAERRSKGPSRPSKTARMTNAARRTGKDLVAFRKLLKAERKRGVSVTELARQHGVTPSYIYQMK